MRARRLAIAAGIGAVSVAALTLLRGRRNGLPGTRRLRLERGLAAVRLAARGGARYATSAPRLFASAGEHREALRNDLALQTAEDVAATLGTMKGVLMKLGQMASYVDDGLSPAARRTLSRLQDSVPPMSPELAAQVITEELGQPPDQAFATWDPEPIAAASIGQVHRAITRDGRAALVTRDGDSFISILTVDGTKVEYSKRDLSAGMRPYGLDVSADGSIAVVANIGRGQGDNDTVSIIDLQAQPVRVVETVVVGQTPEGIALSPDGKLCAVVVMNGSNKPRESPFYNANGKLLLYRVDGTKLVPAAAAWIGR